MVRPAQVATLPVFDTARFGYAAESRATPAALTSFGVRGLRPRQTAAAGQPVSSITALGEGLFRLQAFAQMANAGGSPTIFGRSARGWLAVTARCLAGEFVLRRSGRAGLRTKQPASGQRHHTWQSSRCVGRQQQVHTHPKPWPNMSVKRTRNGMAPWPRGSACTSSASRPGRHAAAGRLPLR